MASFSILDDELIDLLSGKFNVEDYRLDFDFAETSETIKELKPIKIEEISVIESDLNHLEPDAAENKMIEPDIESLDPVEKPAEKVDPAIKENKIKEPDFIKFKLEREEIKLMSQEDAPRKKVQQIKLTQPEAPSERPQVLNLPESPDDLGYLEIDIVARDYISKEVKLIKSLAEQFSRENPKEIPPLKQKSEKTVSPAPQVENENLKTEDKSSLELKEEKPKYPKPQKVKTEARPSPVPKETDKSSPLEFQYGETEERALGIPFDAFDLSDFKLEDIIEEDTKETDDILNDQDLLLELYGDGADQNGNSAGAPTVESEVADSQPNKKATASLEQETVPKNVLSKPFKKFSADFNDKLNAIIEDTITETIESSLNDLLPQIVEKIIHKKLNK